MTNNVTLVFHDGTRVTVSGAELTVERQEWKWNFVEDENGVYHIDSRLPKINEVTLTIRGDYYNVD